MERITLLPGFVQVLKEYVTAVPRNHTLQEIFEGIFYILRTGAQWRFLPRDYPPKSTCYFWYRKLLDDGTLDLILEHLVKLLEEWGKINLSETYVDATFLRSKAGSEGIGKTKCGKGRKLMTIADNKARPIALLLESATPAEIKLLQKTVDFCATDKKPERIIGDKAYDDDKSDAALAEQGIELIAPNRKNRKKNFQDGRKLRRYKRRHFIENFFAHLGNFRRINITFEKYTHTAFGFILLASIHLILGKI